MTKPKAVDQWAPQGRKRKELPVGTIIIDPKTGEPLPHCRFCGRSLRPKGGTPADYPGTAPRNNNSCCAAPECRDQNRNGSLQEVDCAADLPDPVEPQPALEWYLHQRRLRLLNDALAVRAMDRSKVDQFTR